MEEHNYLLRGVFNIVEWISMHINASMLIVRQLRVNYLRYDLEAGGFSLDSYIHMQRDKLSPVNSRGEVRKIISFFNVCGSVCPGLGVVFRPLQLALNTKELPRGRDLRK